MFKIISLLMNPSDCFSHLVNIIRLSVKQWSRVITFFDYKYHLVNISCLVKIISSVINQSGIRFYNYYHWVGVNCSNCDCSTRHWSTLFGQFNQLSKKATTDKSIIRNFDLMKNEKKFDLMNSTSWKSEFWSHEIWPPDPESFGQNKN